LKRRYRWGHDAPEDPVERRFGIADPGQIPLKTLSVYRFRSAWNKMRAGLYSPAILDGLPQLAEAMAFTWWEADGPRAIDALREGDVAFFVAYLIRCDIIYNAMVKANAPRANRAYVLRCKAILAGMLSAAEERLAKLGGSVAAASVPAAEQSTTPASSPAPTPSDRSSAEETRS
jgi:hypothetical protein